MTAFLFPGQGSQQPSMLRTPGLCAETLGEAEAFLASQQNLPALTDLDSAEALSNTTNTQLALLIVGIAAARSLTKIWGADFPDVVAGHSVGAFGAAVTAGALTFDEALTGVHVRGLGMESACRGGRWGMMAVLGIGARTAQELVDQFSTESDPLWISDINSRRQVVFSGTADALGQLANAGGQFTQIERTQLLDVTVASHCPLQEPVTEALTKYLSSIPERPLRSDYLTNTGGRRVRASVDVLSDLATSVSQPVRWSTIAEILPELGVSHAAEMPPGHVLTALTARSDLHVIAVADVGFAAAARRLRGT